MLGKLKDLPQISSTGGLREVEGVVLELEGSLEEAPVVGTPGSMVFVGRFCDNVVVCVGKVLLYEELREDFARLHMEGRLISFSLRGKK